MAHHTDAEVRAKLEALFTKLFERGWIDGTIFDDASGKYALRWTAKGRERSAWVREIASDLHLGPKGMLTLIGVCQEHADPMA